MKLKGIVLILLAMLASALPTMAQNQLTMSIKEGVVEDATDMDARIYFPKTDMNDNLCALIKVTPTNQLRNPLTLEIGGLGVVAREAKENGEIWFYISARAKNLRFSCMDYSTPPPLPVQLKAGSVYRLTLHTDAVFQTVQNAVLSATFLKIILNTEGAVVSLGRTEECEMVCKSLTGKIFSERLNYGTYYYRIEHPLYESATGKVEVNASVADQRITLQPAYGYLNITSTPSGAELFVNGKRVGTTPWMSEERYGRGEVSIRLEAGDYYPLRKNVTIVGKGASEKFHFDMKPQFGNVECVCNDAEAEIWIDEELKGKGRWSGRLSSLSQHIVEARRTGHKSQSIVIEVGEGESKRFSIGAPVAMYGVLELQSTPELCDITVDGKPMGTTPTIFQLLVGKHQVSLSTEGYTTDTFEVEIAHNETHAITRNLSKAVAPKPTPKPQPKSYKVGDYYDDGTKQGVIFWIAKDGKSGKIISLTERADVQWCTMTREESYMRRRDGTGDYYDGEANMAVVKKINGWKKTHPAFYWCDPLGDGWYLPAINDLIDFALDNKLFNIVNSKLEELGATPLSARGSYWSSSENDGAYAHTIIIAPYTSSTRAKNSKLRVRAIAKVEF